MADTIYRIGEIVGTSGDGIDAAIRAAITRASQTVRHLDWFEVTQIRGYLRDGAIDTFQVTIKYGFKLED